MNFKDLNIAVEPVKGEFTFHGETISVRSWLPTAAKIEFIQFVVSHAMNPDHGTLLLLPYLRLLLISSISQILKLAMKIWLTLVNWLI